MLLPGFEPDEKPRFSSAMERYRAITARYQAGVSPLEIAAEFGVAYHRVFVAIRRCGVAPRGDNQTLTEEQKAKIILDYQAGKPSTKIANEFGVTKQSILYHLRDAGIPVRTIQEAHKARRLLFREDAFDEITEESAYWIGFLMADGCVTQGYKRATVQVALAAQDGEHIEKLKKFLECQHKISIFKNGSDKPNAQLMHSLQISSDHMAESLARYGVVPRKSKTAKVFLLEDNRDFWRGATDGDGLVTNRRGFPCTGLCGSKDMMEQYRAFCMKHCPNFKMNLAQSPGMYYMTITHRYAQIMIEVLYRDASVALDRKKEVADYFIANPWTRTKKDWRGVSYDDLVSLEKEHGSDFEAGKSLGISRLYFNRLKNQKKPR